MGRHGRRMRVFWLAPGGHDGGNPPSHGLSEGQSDRDAAGLSPSSRPQGDAPANGAVDVPDRNRLSGHGYPGEPLEPVMRHFYGFCGVYLRRLDCR